MTINYIEKGIGLHDAIAAAGHFLEQRDGVWIADDESAVQAIIDAYDPLPEQRAKLHADVAAMRIEKQQAGLTYTFPDGVVGTIQTRDTQDLININGLATRAMMAPGAAFQFRDHENRTHDMAAADIAALATSAAGFIEALYQAKWAHDNAIEAWGGATPYDLAQFWPSGV